MQLDPRELELLARFFAKRFPRPEQRAPMLEAAGVPDSDAARARDAWLDILQRAQVRGALPALGRAARTDDPHDANLREVRRLLIGESRVPWSFLAAGLGAFAALLLVLGGGVAWATYALLVGSTQRVAAQPTAHVAVARPAPPADSETLPVLADIVPEASSTPPAEPPAAPAAVPASLAPAVEPAPVPVHRHLTADHCFRKGPAVAGYWYAGSESPGTVGDVIVVPHDVYVRAEPPSAFNGFDPRTPVQCVLYQGDEILLSQAPIEVPVDAWWVGMTGADIVFAGGQQVQSRVAGR